MQSFPYVIRLVALIVGITLTPSAFSQQQIVVDELYCDSLALMSKAGAEAKQRGESLVKWRTSLLAMNGYGVRNQDNVLYRVLPQVIHDVNQVYTRNETPIETYKTSYNACMSKDYGRLLSVAR